MSELLQINVNDHTEKKNGLTYLSWAWAWAEVLKFDPEAEWEAVEYYNTTGGSQPCMVLADGTAMVKTRVMIKGRSKTCLLPVMDHRNKAIPNPNAFQINTAIMRCMTKAISMHGLGLYIYAGEDLPEKSDAETEKLNAIEDLATKCIELFTSKNDIEGVCNAIEAAQLDADSYVELWGHLKPHSKLRSSIKVEVEKRKQAAVVEKAKDVENV